MRFCRDGQMMVKWRLRSMLGGVLVLGLVGTEVELLLLEHYEDWPQFVPLLLIAASLGTVLWHLVRPTAAARGAVRAAMVLLVVSSGIGVGLHFDGASEFQLEMDPSMPRWELVKKVMRVKAPPVLAPGVLLQLGLLGLVYTHRLPAAGGAQGSQESLE